MSQETQQTYSGEAKKRKLKIALLQIAPGMSLEENLEKGIRCCRSAKKKRRRYCIVPGDVE